LSELMPAFTPDLRCVACALLLHHQANLVFAYRPLQHYQGDVLRAAGAATWLMCQVCDGGLKAQGAQQLWQQLLEGGQLLSALANTSAFDLAITLIQCLVGSVGPISQSHAPLIGVLEGVCRSMASPGGAGRIEPIVWGRMLQCLEEALKVGNTL
jgi:hypothetical protein